ncbi:hypothetical protein [Streptomyces zagrosensis]|uniref:Uncharacterized protein n=1 Tax=Streptomyces zagrosensis TaxID=1042984 RepID=A0A7W9Q927_9ACTN|nr:hypothetical protein [Streptomyces zagrosensis]MBB5934932.1 hypothetical protein [Streptomyces zagrosensis]
MAASAQLLPSALAKQVEPDLYEGVSDPESGLDGSGSCGFAEQPLTSEPPLSDAAPLTSEPPLGAELPLTSEPTAAAYPVGRADTGQEPAAY